MAALPDAPKMAGCAERRRTDWSAARIPPHARALLEGLSFGPARNSGLVALDAFEWRRLLEFSDAAQLTLLLGRLRQEQLPEWVRARIARNASRYAWKFQRLKDALWEIARALDREGIPFVALKGITHAPEFTPDPLLRAQSDIDLWCPGSLSYDARKTLLTLGYSPFGNSRGRHLPPMIRDTDWTWTGDYFAPDLPIAVEVHYELWDRASEFLDGPCERECWARRTTLELERYALPALSLADTAGFAALHLLMHILHGDLRLQRAWELANFLEQRADDAEFWGLWREQNSEPLRRMEAVVFALAARWFAARIPSILAGEIDRLPADVRLWLDSYECAPVENLFRPNKREIWLHAALLHSKRHAARVFFRRTFPAVLPAGGSSGGDETAVAEFAHRAVFLTSRLLRHARALIPTLWSGVEWKWKRARMNKALR